MILQGLNIVIEVGKRMELDKIAKETNSTVNKVIIQMIDKGIDDYLKSKENA